MIDSTLATVEPAAPPPGTRHTATASTRRIAMLRRCLLRSGPTDAEDSPRALGVDGFGGQLGQGDGHRAVDRLGIEPVADPEVRVDVAPVRRDLLELLAQLAHEDVHGAVAVDHGVAPDALVDLLARDDLAAEVAQQRDQLELAAREVHGAACGEGLELIPADLELPRHHGLGVRAHLGPAAAPDHGFGAGDDLLGMARLGHPVVGAEPEP